MKSNAIKIIEILESAGYEARIAGGAVRDELLGIAPKDYDVATTALPEQVIKIFTDRHLDVIETGLQHGTVSVVIDRIPYEITTLRIDVETDGRHAKVEFTDNWELDAARRDFTINAMYMDGSDQVYDYFDGKKDLDVHRVTFVGEASERIKEDYLRILRFFRFGARFGGFSFPTRDLEAIRVNRFGLKNISKERIWWEIKKITDYNVDYVYTWMNATGVSGIIFGKELPIEKNIKMDDFELTLLSMGIGSEWFKEMKSPSDVIKNVEFHENFVPGEFHYDLFVHGFKKMKDHAKLKGYDWDFNVNVPAFPMNGNDLKHLKGAEIGAKLKELQKAWAATGYSLTRKELEELV